MSHGFRWFIYLTVMILNFIAYYQDPSRYSLEPKCYFNTPCKWFNYVAGMITFTLDILTFIGLWYTIAPQMLYNFLPSFWYIPFIILGYAIITQITIDSDIYKNHEDILAQPPEYMWAQKWRIVLYTIIMVLDIIIFAQLYIDSGANDYTKKLKIFDVIVKGRFGSWAEGNYINFIFSWLGITCIIIDTFAIYNTVTFNSCIYGLPVSWNF